MEAGHYRSESIRTLSVQVDVQNIMDYADWFVLLKPTTNSHYKLKVKLRLSTLTLTLSRQVGPDFGRGARPCQADVL